MEPRESHCGGSRRQFLKTATLVGAGLLGVHSQRPPVMAARARGRMRITDIERHEYLIPLHEFNALDILRYHSAALQYRTLYIVKTDVGLEGYGESWGKGSSLDRCQKYLGTDPFDWIGDPENLFMNMATYDLMGKYLNVPAWKLIGQQIRKWVPVAAWTVSRRPEAMAEEVTSVSHRGYRWLKYHVDVMQNVIAQTEAMQKVAPPGFKVHYDFNAHQNLESVYPVLKELERFPIAGRVEDPISPKDREGYRILRQKCRLTILGHHVPPDEFLLNHLVDGYMAGHAPIGAAARLNAIAESVNTPMMLQQAGGQINQAFLAHEASVLKMASIDHVNLCHLWTDDITNERMEVVGGSVQVPAGPGLGLTLNRDKLTHYTKQKPRDVGRYIMRTRYESGLTVYFRHDPTQPGAVDNLRAWDPPYVPGPAPGYGHPVVTDFWDAEGDARFETLWKQTAEGPVWTQRAR